MKPFLTPFLLACAVSLVFALPSSASSAKTTPCWITLLRDWSDNGHIDKVYPRLCYRQAISHLPGDIATYSDARQDIQRALSEAVTKKLKVGTATPLTTTETKTEANGDVTTITTPVTTSSSKDKGPVARAINDLNPSSPDAFPLPLLILGALAILLVLAGIGGMAYRRFAGGDPNEPGGPATP